jgi:polar amino acid transport system ATP-binding protein
MDIVNAQLVSKSFGAVAVLKSVSMQVEPGQLVALIGRSGSGKSTFLRCLNGLETIGGGSVEIAGHTITAAGMTPARLRSLRQDVGIVFQSYNLFPHLTVEKNITLALNLVKKLPKAETRAIAKEVLTHVHLEEKLDAYPDQLSGGQQQRVAIARSLAMKPKVMLFDEVTSALDPELTEEVLAVMEDLSNEGMTMIIVTHEMAFASRAADVVHFMHDGMIHESGPPEAIFKSPSTAALQQFLSKTK